MFTHREGYGAISTPLISFQSIEIANQDCPVCDAHTFLCVGASRRPPLQAQHIDITNSSNKNPGQPGWHGKCLVIGKVSVPTRSRLSAGFSEPQLAHEQEM